MVKANIRETDPGVLVPLPRTAAISTLCLQEELSAHLPKWKLQVHHPYPTTPSQEQRFTQFHILFSLSVHLSTFPGRGHSEVLNLIYELF